MILCALNLDSSFAEAKYLLSRMIKYASRGKYTPALPLGKDVLEKLILKTDLP